MLIIVCFFPKDFTWYICLYLFIRIVPWFLRLFGINSCNIVNIFVWSWYPICKRIYLRPKKVYAYSSVLVIASKLCFCSHKGILFYFCIKCVLYQSCSRLLREIKFFSSSCVLYSTWAEGTNLADPISPEGMSHGILHNNTSISEFQYLSFCWIRLCSSGKLLKWPNVILLNLWVD